MKACSTTNPNPNTNTNTNPNSSKACRNTNPNPNSFKGMQHHYAASAHEEAHEYGKQLSRLTYATNRVAEAVLHG